jgi:DNA sulfur modification protein DndD
LALLKTSRKDIPFFIDTPFARIDSSHREKIVKEFFSVISNQMFILSTDEEIVGEYKSLIDENISNEFMLNITNYGKTRVVPNSYFEV